MIGAGGRHRCGWRLPGAGQVGRQPGQPGKASQPGRPGGPAGLVWDHFGVRNAVIHRNPSKSRTCFNSVSLKVSRHGRFSVPQRLREGQNGVCFNRVSCKMDKKYDYLERFVSFRMDETLLKQGRDAFWSFSSENVKNRRQSRPKFSRSRLSIGNFRKYRRQISDGW